MTAKGIAALRKRYAHVGNKESAIQEIDPVLKEAEDMLNVVRSRILELR